MSRLFRWQTTNTLAILEDAAEGLVSVFTISMPFSSTWLCVLSSLSLLHACIYYYCYHLCTPDPSLAIFSLSLSLSLSLCLCLSLSLSPLLTHSLLFLSSGSHDIPHFSQPALTESYAKVEHLTYIHYLTRGQPSFAFANFVAAKLLGRSNTSRR